MLLHQTLQERPRRPTRHRHNNVQRVTNGRQIDLTQEDIIQLDPTGPEQVASSVPRTPEALANTDAANRSTLQRPGEDLDAPATMDTAETAQAFNSLYNKHTKLLRHTTSVYILSNATPGHDDNTADLRTWARLDLKNDKIKTTDVNGPRKNQILRRRMWTKNGKMLFDRPYIRNKKINKSSFPTQLTLLPS